MCTNGSSPRVRGKRMEDALCRRLGRLIPACAGKTCLRDFASARVPAHPRVCGENRALHEATAHHRGSSPRVRGKPVAASAFACDWGLIPACAGKTVCVSEEIGVGGAHPRVCGENKRKLQLFTDEEGSSPRVRGKRGAQACMPKAPRLIPACAGKTGVLGPVVRDRSAHPRVCGENQRRS